MTAQPVEQRSLFELPTPTNYDGLPVSPYPTVPYAAGSETSRAAAAAIAPKQGTLQARVLLALLHTPGLSDEALDRVLGTTQGRSARPRRVELSKSYYDKDGVYHPALVEANGHCEGGSRLQVNCWQLTRDGEAAARELEAAT